MHDKKMETIKSALVAGVGVMWVNTVMSSIVPGWPAWYGCAHCQGGDKYVKKTYFTMTIPAVIAGFILAKNKTGASPIGSAVLAGAIAPTGFVYSIVGVIAMMN